jgi:hypothetical protein
MVSKGWLWQVSATVYLLNHQRYLEIDSPDTQLCNSRKDTGDETLPLAAVSCGDDFLAVILHRHESSKVPDIATMMVKFIIASLE